MTTSKEINDVRFGGSSVVKIMSGGATLWEKKVIDILNLNDRPPEDSYIRKVVVDGKNVYALQTVGSDKANFYRFELSNGKLIEKNRQMNIECDSEILIHPKDAKDSVIFTVLKRKNSYGYDTEVLCSFDLSGYGSITELSDKDKRIQYCKSGLFDESRSEVFLYASNEFHYVDIRKSGNTPYGSENYYSNKHFSKLKDRTMPFVYDMRRSSYDGVPNDFVLTGADSASTPPKQMLADISYRTGGFYGNEDIGFWIYTAFPDDLSNKSIEYHNLCSVHGRKDFDTFVVSEDGRVYFLTKEFINLPAKTSSEREAKKNAYDVKLKNPKGTIVDAVCDYTKSRIVVEYERRNYDGVAYTVYDLGGNAIKDIKVNTRSTFNPYGFGYSDGYFIYTYIDENYGSHVICCEQI